MAIARNGDVIICGLVVRKGGVVVLRLLAAQETAITVPQLGKIFPGECSDAELYSVLNRLWRRPTLITRTETFVEVTGKQLRRVLWETTPAVKKFFLENPPP